MEDKKFVLGVLCNPSFNYFSLHDCATLYWWDFNWELF